MNVVPDGFYKIDFHAALPGIGGVVAIENNVIRGGDNQYLYSGAISANGDGFTGEIVIAAYTPGAQSVFRTAGGKFVLKISGGYSAERFTANAPSPFPGQPSISTTGTKVANLTL